MRSFSVILALLLISTAMARHHHQSSLMNVITEIFEEAMVKAVETVGETLEIMELGEDLKNLNTDLASNNSNAVNADVADIVSTMNGMFGLNMTGPVLTIVISTNVTNGTVCTNMQAAISEILAYSNNETALAAVNLTGTNYTTANLTETLVDAANQLYTHMIHVCGANFTTTTTTTTTTTESTTTELTSTTSESPAGCTICETALVAAPATCASNILMSELTACYGESYCAREWCGTHGY